MSEPVDHTPSFGEYYGYYMSGLFRGDPPKETYKYLCTLAGPKAALGFLMAAAGKGMHLGIDLSKLEPKEEENVPEIL